MCLLRRLPSFLLPISACLRLPDASHLPVTACSHTPRIWMSRWTSTFANKQAVITLLPILFSNDWLFPFAPLWHRMLGIHPRSPSD
ncbi:hypothetical protein M413DRAFT_440127 [Hebeloma cylindrosporum]|uniref:Uncharacterized protein n=1 Tax=Hebeloma cylindrosporum TaxID=76867 RepID=A0A0C2Z5B3_HEBCY|nr:hypothetical protein M413DRAFT_440127 [Hebeloma cylindrosporum h7]